MLVVLLTNKNHMDSTGDSTLYIAHKNAQIILVKILSSSQANDKLIRPPIKATHKETSLRGPNIRKWSYTIYLQLKMIYLVKR